MTVYYVDDGGSATDPYDTWAKAATSLSALDDAKSLASGDIIYIGHDHVCQYTHAANRTITGPTSGGPTYIISATQGSSPPTYAASTTNQIDTTEGAYQLLFDGSFALYGVSMAAGDRLQIGNDTDEGGYAYECTFKLANNKDIYIGTSNSSHQVIGCTINCAADSGAQTASIIVGASGCIIDLIGCTIASATNRTGNCINANSGAFFVSGCDFSSLTNATACELFLGSGNVVASNCITAASWTPYLRSGGNGVAMLTNVGPADAPTYIFKGTYYGDLVSDTGVTRGSGGTVEGTACSWKIVTTANCSEGTPFWSPWMYATLSGTPPGSKTFSVAIANNGSALTDAEAWIEVEYLGTTDEANTTFGSDHRTVTTTAAAQTTDGTSSWSGATLGYLQTLASPSVSVNEDGIYRARVAIAKASATVYVDPLVTVS